MLFMFTGRPRAGLAEADQQRALGVFRGWTPPSGMTIKAHYVAATGGDFVIVETSSVEAMIEAVAVWAPFITYEVVPIVEASDGAASMARGVTIRTQIV